MTSRTRQLAITFLATLALWMPMSGVAAQDVRPATPTGKEPRPEKSPQQSSTPTPTQTPTPAPAATPEPTVAPTQLDWAIAQWRVDHWIAEHKPSGPLAERISREWDHATKMRLQLLYELSVKSMNEAMIIAQDDPDTAWMQRVLLSLRVRMIPLVMALDQPTQVSASVQPVYTVSKTMKGQLACKLQVLGNDGKPILDAPFTLHVSEKGVASLTFPVDTSGKSLQPGSYWVQVQPPAGAPIMVTRWTVAAQSLSKIHDDNARILAQATRPDSALTTALASARIRNGLLTDFPSEDYTTSLLLDLEQLSRDVTKEANDIAAGTDPYVRKSGDICRDMPWGDHDHRYRVYAPESACGRNPVPLVIMLNLMGGDENLFFDIYGTGEIKRQADKHGFVVASTHLATFGMNPLNLPLLIEEMARCYSIDRTRIYVIGHATGAEVLNRWLVNKPNVVTAAGLISSGAWFKEVSTIPPIMVVSGEVDAIVPLDQTRTACDEAIRAGLPVTFRSYPDCGHNTVVGAAMPDLVTWLLQQKSPEPKKP